MKRKKCIILAIVTIALAFGACTNKEKVNVDNVSKESASPDCPIYECDQFSVSAPAGYYMKMSTIRVGLNTLTIGADSLDDDVTSITWESPGTFPSDVRDFVTIFAYKEIEEFKQSDTFYDIMKEDSTYTIDGYPTYSIVSIFAEGEDTIIQGRTGLIIPDKFDMMITQRANTKSPMSKVEKDAEIMNSIRIKE